MNAPLVTWGCIVALFVIILIVRLFNAVMLRSKVRHQHHNLITLGSEREEFFVPGDPYPRKANSYDYEDTEDL